MIKKSVLVLILITFGMVLYCVPQDIGAANNIVENFLNYKGVAAEVSSISSLTENRDDLVYIFELEPPDL